MNIIKKLREYVFAYAHEQICERKIKMKANKSKIFTAIALSAITITAAGCSGSTDNASAETTAQTEDMTVLSDKHFSATDEYVKLIGRTHFSGDTRWVAQSAAGVEFTFTGTKASVTLAGDSNATPIADKTALARYAVYVNGERKEDGMMDSSEKTIEILSSDSEETNTVTILKLSECANSTFGIKGIDVTSVGNIEPTKEKSLKIEFIGDSITCGYGVDDEVKEHHFSTETEDATKTYAYKTAEILDADYSLVSYSGHGIISGYSGDKKKHADQTVPEYYAKLGRSYGGKCGDFSVSEIEWDFSTFTPDAIVINLGTNDDSYTAGDDEKVLEYVDGYVAFLEQVREHNPDSYILCTLGIMGDRLYPGVEEAVNQYVEKTGDEKVSAMRFEPQQAADGYAADWHPTEATHAKAAEKLSEELKGIIG